jgi:hypothetical protein
MAADFDPGKVIDVKVADVLAFDVIGWDVAAVPEPSSLWSVAIAVFGIAFHRLNPHRRR